MEKLVKGDVVVIPFPFSNLTESRRRPALVIASMDGDDVILCQITSQHIKDKHAIVVDEDDFEKGNLKKKSNVRANRIFTADRHIILYCIGHLKKEKVNKIIDCIVDILKK